MDGNLLFFEKMHSLLYFQHYHDYLAIELQLVLLCWSSFYVSDDCDYTTFKSNNMWSQGVPKGYCFSAPTGASGPGKYMQEYCDRNRKGFRLATINSQEKQNAVAAHLRGQRFVCLYSRV